MIKSYRLASITMPWSILLIRSWSLIVIVRGERVKRRILRRSIRSQRNSLGRNRWNIVKIYIQKKIKAG